MALLITNVAESTYLTDPTTGKAIGFFDALEQMSVDFDSSHDPIYFGRSNFPQFTISKDKKPMANLTSPELSLHLANKIIGMKTTTATLAAPMNMPNAQLSTIGADGKVSLKHPISTSVATVTVITRLDFKEFTTAATAPTAGQFLQPLAGATELQFNIADVGKQVNIAYSWDSSAGARMDYGSDSEPSVVGLVSVGQCVNTADPSKIPFVVTIVIPQCQMIGKWALDGQRNKVSQSKTELLVLDPGAGTPPISIFQTGVSNFA